MIKNEIKEILLNLLAKFRWFHFVIFTFIILINVFLCIYTTILDRINSIENISINIESNDMNYIKNVNIFLISPADKIIKFKIGKTPNNWIWQGMIKKLLISIPENYINNFNKIVVNIGNKEFSYNLDEFNKKWKRSNDFNLNGKEYITFISPEDLKISRSFFTYNKLKSIINYKGEIVIIKENIYRIFFISVFISLVIYISYYLIVKPYFKKNYFKFKELLKMIDLRIIVIFIISFILVFIFYIIFNFTNKILLYFLIIIPFIIMCYEIVNKTLDNDTNIINRKSINKINIFILFILLLILMIGFILRIIGIDYGFPLILDSSIYSIVDSSRDVIKNMTLDTNFYMRPNHISIYINTICYEAVSIFIFHKPFIDTFNDNILFYNIISLVITALSGTAMSLIGYFIGKEYNKIFGLIIAVYISIFSVFMNNSHGINPDQSLTCLIMLVILFSIKYLKNPSNKNFFFMSLFSVLSLLEKYPGIISFFLVISVIIIKDYKSGYLVKKLIFSGFLFFILLFIISPFFFIRIYTVLYEFFDEARAPVIRRSNFLLNLYNYPMMYLYASGLIMLVFLIIGIVAIIKNEKILSLPLFFGFLYYILLSKIDLCELRWAIPMYVSPVIFSCYGIYFIIKKINNLKIKYLLNVIIIFLILIAFLNTFLKGLQYSLISQLKETRVISTKYIEINKLNKDEILSTGFDPVFPSVRNDEFFQLYENSIFMDKIKYFIISSYVYDSIISRKNIFQKEIGIFEEILKNNILVAEFKSDKEYKTDFLLEYKNILNGIKYINYYFKNKNFIYSGPNIYIYKKISSKV